MKKTFLIVQIAVLAAGLSCGRTRHVTAPTEVPETLRDLTKKIAGPPGYPTRSDPVFFHEANLYEAINGMAPEYISYGCIALGMLEWAKTPEAEERFQAEIYDMGSALGAFGIYSRAHTGTGEFCDVGEEAAVSEDSIEFNRGRYYVRLMGPMDSGADLKKMARAIVARVAPGPRPESFLKDLPREGRVLRTERWMPEGAFGMEFLRKVWIARYRLGDRELELFLAPFENERAVGLAAERFRETVKERSPQSVDGEYPGFVYSDEWIGRIGVFRVGRKLAVVVGHDDADTTERLLKLVENRQEAGS